MIATKNLVISRMKRKDMDTVINWAAQEGWNPGLFDAECFYNTDPEGFFVAKNNGVPVGSISAVAYDDSYGFIGLYIVKPDYRGGIVGPRLAREALDYLGSRCIGLDGVITKVDNYKNAGFMMAYRNVRFTGTAKGAPSANVIDLCEVPLEEVVRYDTEMFSAPRGQFVSNWIKQPGRITLGYLHKGELAGYTVARKCYDGYKIAPLFADDDYIAEELFDAISHKIEGQTIYMDVPEINTSAVALANRNDMEVIFETARMYSKNTYAIPIENVFGITSFELG